MSSDLVVGAVPPHELAERRQRSNSRRARVRRTQRVLLELPTEILLRILNFSCNTPHDITSFSLVCRSFRRYSQEEDLWKKICLKTFSDVNPVTLLRCGSWRSLIRNKSIIENSPWTVRPEAASLVIQNQLLSVTSMAVGERFIVCGGGTFDEPFEMGSLFVERTVNIYDRQTGALHSNLHCHLGTVLDIALHDRYFIASGGGGRSRLWKYKSSSNSWEFRRTFKGHDRSVFNVKFDKRTVVTSGRDGAVKVWDFRTAALLRSIPAHSKSINGMDWNRKSVATAGQDRQLNVWRVETGQCSNHFEGKNWFFCVKMQDNLLVTGGEGKVRLWDTRSGQNERSYAAGSSFPPAWITSLQFDDNKIVAGSFNRDCYVWDFNSTRILNRWTAHDDKITAIYYENNELFTSSRDRTVRRWDFDSEPSLPTPTPARRPTCATM